MLSCTNLNVWLTGRLLKVSFWPFASFSCAVEFGRDRGRADSGKSSARQIYRFTP